MTNYTAYDTKFIDDAITNEDVSALMDFTRKKCACLGAREGHKLCPCEEKFKYLRSKISFFALQRGKVVKLRGSL